MSQLMRVLTSCDQRRRADCAASLSPTPRTESCARTRDNSVKSDNLQLVFWVTKRKKVLQSRQGVYESRQLHLVDTRYTKYAATNAHDTGTIGVTTTIATICSTTETNLITIVCPKCGTQKSGQRNCGARGGSWFGKCGDPADSDLEHTWSEGLKTCETTVVEATPTTQG